MGIVDVAKAVVWVYIAENQTDLTGLADLPVTHNTDPTLDEPTPRE